MLLLTLLLFNCILFNTESRKHVMEKTDMFKEYNRYNAILIYLSTLAKQYSDKVKVLNIGLSYAGWKINAVKISGDPFSKHDKPMILVDAGMHAREWMAPAAALYLIEQLATNKSNENLIEHVDWIIIPVLNPDGYEYSHTNNINWRKTISSTSEGDGICSGVDINRNFDFHWLGLGASRNVCASNYAGPFPFSESETRALRDLSFEFQRGIKLYISMHAYGSMVIYPWSYTEQPIRNVMEHEYVGKAAAKAITKYRGTKYVVGQASNMLYYGAGSSLDWMAGIVRVPLNFGIEMPETHARFNPPASQILPTGAEIFEGFKRFHKYVKIKWVRSKNH